MAKKYKKMNYAKTLTRTGSTFAVAMAVTVALANQAQASELPVSSEEELPVTPAEEIAAASTSSSIAVDPSEVSEVNAEISQSNAEAAEENTAAAENNEIIDADNNSAIAENNTNTDGELPATDLPELPEAPEAPEIPNTDTLEGEEHNKAVDGYNEKVDGYNEQVDGYNEAVDGYNEIVDGYNEAADIRDSEVQDQYQKELDEYNKYLDEQQAHDDAYQAYLEEIARLEAEHNAAQDKAEADHNAAQEQAEADHEAARAEAEAAHNAAEERAKAEHEATEQAAYDAAKAEAEAAHKAAEEKAKAEYEAAELKAYEDAKAKAEADHEAAQDKAEADHEAAQDKAEADHEAAQDQAEADHEAAQDKLEADHEAAKAKAEAAYEADKKAYEDAVATEEQIYDDVTEYNNGILEDNADINDLNEALENDLHADLVDSIEEVGKINENVAVDGSVLETLNGYNGLLDQLKALEDAAAALDAHTGKDASLGSDEYAAYLADVEAYNDAVTKFNTDAAAYNAAVEAYNTAVEKYNQEKLENATPDSSTDVGTEQGTADIDWGNVNFDGRFDYIQEDHLTHIDVKYNAAASKEVTVEYDEEGNKKETYSDSVNQYTVTGVFTDKETADEESGKRNPSYGLSYSNDGWKTTETQALKKDGSYDEFGNTSWNHTGENLDPVTGEISFYVTLTDANGSHGITVNMNAGSVYADGSYYRAEADDFLKDYVGKDGKKLETVIIDGVEYYDVSGESVYLISALTCDGMTKSSRNGTVKLTAHGLDLILNLQTMIEIHQSENAQKIGYLAYEFGKTAQAEKVEHKTYEEINGEFEYPEFQRTKYERTKYERTEYEREDFTYPDFEPTKYEEKEFVYPDFEPTKYEGKDFVYPDFEPTDFERKEFAAPEYDGPGTPDEVAPPEDVLLETQRLEHVEKLTKLDKLMRNAWTPPTDPDPTPGTTDPEPMVVDVEDPEPVIIPDEPVPLAKAPKTGDLSGLWALLSGMSLGGMGLLNRKRKEEE